METYFVIFWMAVIPLVNWYQPQNGRGWLLAVTVSMYVAAELLSALGNGFRPAIHMFSMPDIYAAGFAVFAAMSCAWSQNPRKSIEHALIYSAMFIVYMAVQSVQPDIVIMALYLPGVIMLPLLMYQVYTKKKHGEYIERNGVTLMAKPCGSFGNTNHLGVYLMGLFFPGIWLAWNVSGLFWIPQLLMAAAILLSGCRAAWVGLLAGLAVICYVEGHTAMTAILVMTGGGFLATKIVHTSGHARLSFFRLALKLIRKNPIFGTGPGSFMWGQHYVAPQQDKPSVTNNVHNDILEITVETGFIGLALCALFVFALPLSADPVLTAGIAAILISAMFFSTFREVHTTLPFAAMAGLLSAQSPPEVSATLPIELLLIAAAGLLAVTYRHAIKKIMGAHAHMKMLKAQTRQQAIDAIFKALKHDPYNNDYLMFAFEAAGQATPPLAVQCATRMAEHFDGEIPLKIVEEMQPKIIGADQVQSKGGE